MNKNLENVCRVCLNSGSRNIFEKSPNDSQFAIPAIGENVSSLDRLVEKLRYVTMLKVSFQRKFQKKKKTDNLTKGINILFPHNISHIHICIHFTKKKKRKKEMCPFDAFFFTLLFKIHQCCGCC